MIATEQMTVEQQGSVGQDLATGAGEERLDDLKRLDTDQLRLWCGRLSEMLSKQRVAGTRQLVSFLLSIWLENRVAGAKHIIDAPAHLRENPLVHQTLREHRRLILFTEKARLLGRGRSTAGLGARATGPTPPPIVAVRGVPPRQRGSRPPRDLRPRRRR